MLSITSSRRVKSVQTAFRIVHLLQDLDTATQSQLASELDIAQSTVHNYLSTLEELGYVTNHDGEYALGLRFFTHGMAARNHLRIGDTVNEVLATLSQDVSLPAWWVVEELGRGVFIARGLPTDGREVYGRLGKRSYLHTHAPGKAILAHLSPSYVAQIVEHHGLPVHTTGTTTDVDELTAELDAIREDGFALSSGEAALGIQSIGRAFEGPYNSTHAVGIFGYTHDFGGISIDDDVSRHLKVAVDNIEDQIETWRINR